MAQVKKDQESILISQSGSQKEERKSTSHMVKPQQQTETLAPEGYKFIKTIGDGSFGKVKLGVHVLTEEKVAIKILCKQKIRERTDIERISREIKIMKQVRHPFIVQMYQIIESPKYLFLIMEFIERGDLFDEISNKSKLPQAQCKKIFTQIVLGLQYLHNSGITHRDMKPENILIDSSGNIKIADFGLGNFFTADQTLKTACGSPCYAPPQMLNQQEYNPRKVDIWSSGIILYAMVHGYLPFEDDVTALLYEKIKTKNVRVASWVSIPCRNLIRGLLAKSQVQRWDMQTIKKHQFLHDTVQIEQKYVIKEISQINMEQFDNICQHLGIMEQDRLLNSLKKNKHNNLTTLYYLAKKKYTREKQSIEDKQIVIKQEETDNIQKKENSDDRNIYSFFQKEETPVAADVSQIQAKQESQVVSNILDKTQNQEDFSNISESLMAQSQISMKNSIEARPPPQKVSIFEKQPIKPPKMEQKIQNTIKNQKPPTKSLNSPSKNRNIKQQLLKQVDRIQKKEKEPIKGLKKDKRMPIYKPKQQTNKNNQSDVKLYERSHSKDKPIILKNHLNSQKHIKTQSEGWGTVVGKVVHIQPHLLDVDRIVICSGNKFCQILEKNGYNGKIEYFTYDKQAIFIAKAQLKASKNWKGQLLTLQKIISQINQNA